MMMKISPEKIELEFNDMIDLDCGWKYSYDDLNDQEMFMTKLNMCHGCISNRQVE